jgi:hypothetical protein
MLDIFDVRLALSDDKSLAHSSIGSLLLNGQNDSDFGKYNIVGSRFK